MAPAQLPSFVLVDDKFQSGYRYELSCAEGAEFAEDFTPDLTPIAMFELGVFGGLYYRDGAREFPAHWFAKARLARGHQAEASLNYFGVLAGQSLREWQRKGWIHPDDPRGWFQWYCRYYRGRRHGDDARQIKRWKAFSRHLAQIKRGCEPHDFSCRPRQRQALLQWAYDSRAI